MWKWHNNIIGGLKWYNPLLCVYVCYRKEVKTLGLTVLVDARRCSPVPALFKAFTILQVRTQPCNYPPVRNAISGCPNNPLPLISSGTTKSILGLNAFGL